MCSRVLYKDRLTEHRHYEKFRGNNRPILEKSVLLMRLTTDREECGSS